MPAVFTVMGIQYAVDWDRMLPGCSFFMKTTATWEQVLKVLRPYAEACNYIIMAQNRCEFDFYGVRVWRLG